MNNGRMIRDEKSQIPSTAITRILVIRFQQCTNILFCIIIAREGTIAYQELIRIRKNRVSLVFQITNSLLGIEFQSKLICLCRRIRSSRTALVHNQYSLLHRQHKCLLLQQTDIRSILFFRQTPPSLLKKELLEWIIEIQS